MKIVIATDFFGSNLAEELAEGIPGADFVAAFDTEAQMRELADADGVVGWPPASVLKGASRLRWVHVPGMGIDAVLTDPTIGESDIIVTNSPGPHTNPMADHVMYLVLALAHQSAELLDDQRARRWDPNKYRRRVVELNGTHMGLLGVGGIGRAVAQRALAFGMQVYAVDPSPTDIPAGVREVWGIERLDEMIEATDWLVVTAPLTEDTRGIIDARRLALMRPSAHLIVISRGGIVDEAALAEALQAGKLAGAGIDATAVEPLPCDSPLWDLDNVLISPHSSADSKGLWTGRRQIIEDQVRRFVNDQPLAFICDPGRGY